MGEIDFLELVDSCLCTSIRKISRVITRVYDSYLEPSGININQLGLLLTIKGKNEADSEASLTTIGQRLVMEKSTLSRNLRKLENLGLIEMDVNQENRSQKQAKITDKGLSVVFDAYQYWDEVQDRIQSSFGAVNFSQLIGLLNRLQNDVLSEFNEISP